jgi:CRP/FNR family transcriptional regulator, cyclic AMP receptor protein
MNFAELFHHESNLHELEAGQALFKEGDEQNGLMYVLMSGTAEIWVKDRKMETAEAGAILGEMAMIDDDVRSATVVAVNNCRLLPLDRQRFNFLIQNTPNFAQCVMRVIAKRLRRTDVEL